MKCVIFFYSLQSDRVQWKLKLRNIRQSHNSILMVKPSVRTYRCCVKWNETLQLRPNYCLHNLHWYLCINGQFSNEIIQLDRNALVLFGDCVGSYFIRHTYTLRFGHFTLWIWHSGVLLREQHADILSEVNLVWYTTFNRNFN